MNSEPGRRRCAGVSCRARRLRVRGGEKCIQCVDGRICELLYANATTRAREGPSAPRDSGRGLRQTRDWEQIPKSSTAWGTACVWLFSRGGSKAKPELSLSLRDVVRPETSPGYLPFIICSIFISSFIASDISRMMDAGSSANAPSPGTSSRCWLSR